MTTSTVRVVLRRRARVGGEERQAYALALGILLAGLASLSLPEEGPWLRARAAALLVVSAWLAWWTVSRRSWSAARRAAALALPFHRLLLLFLAWIALSTLRSGFPEVSRYELLRYLGCGLLYLGVAYGLYVRALPRLTDLLVLCAWLASLVAFLKAGTSGSARISGAFGDEQLFAAVLCLLLPITVAVAQEDERPLNRLFGLMALVMLSVGLLAARNRSAWLGALVGLAVLAWLRHRHSRTSSRAAAGWRELLVPALTATIVLGLFLAHSLHTGDIAQRLQSFAGLGTDPSVQRRGELWRGALDLAWDHPLLGAGPGTFAVHSPLLVPDSRQQVEIVAGGASLAESAHSYYLQLAAEAGFPALALYLALLVSFLSTVAGRLPGMRDSFRRTAAISAVAAVSGQSVCALGSPAWEYPECAAFLYAVMGMGVLATGLTEGSSRRCGQRAGAEPAGEGPPGEDADAS